MLARRDARRGRGRERLFWEGIGKICTTKSDIRISHLDSEGFHPTTEGSNWDSNSTRNGIN
jgi:hypothetical protein